MSDMGRGRGRAALDHEAAPVWVSLEVVIEAVIASGYARDVPSLVGSPRRVSRAMS
jgi:hypothetical protein